MWEVCERLRGGVVEREGDTNTTTVIYACKLFFCFVLVSTVSRLHMYMYAYFRPPSRNDIHVRITHILISTS